MSSQSAGNKPPTNFASSSRGPRAQSAPGSLSDNVESVKSAVLSILKVARLLLNKFLAYIAPGHRLALEVDGHRPRPDKDYRECLKLSKYTQAH